MKLIEPFKNLQEAIQALDNGGRFYNFLTKADDGIITQSEIGKIAGVINNKQKVALFLSLSTSHLDSGSQNMIFSKLDEKLSAAYNQHKPKQFSHTDEIQTSDISINATLSGTPKHVESKTNFSGFIMIPIMVGSITTFSMVPIIDHLEVYELNDSATGHSYVIAHPKGKQTLPNKEITIAGVVKELKQNISDKIAQQTYLDVQYYLEGHDPQLF